MKILYAPEAGESAGAGTTVDSPPNAAETATRRTALAGWMEKVKGDLPNVTPLSSAPAPNGNPDPKPANPIPPAAPAAAAPTPDTEVDEAKWPRSGEDWKTYKAKEKERRAKLSQQIEGLQKELTEIKAKPAQPIAVTEAEEYKTLQKNYEELSDRLRTVDVQQHPRFQTYFQSQIDAQLDIAKSVVAEDQRERIADILTAPDSPWRTQQLEEVIDNLGPLGQSRLGGVMNKLDDINREKKSEISKGRELYDKMQADNKAKVVAQQEFIKKSVADALEKEKDKESGNPAYQLKEDSEENRSWNKEVNDRHAFIKNVFDGKVAPEVILKTLINGAAHDALVSTAHKMFKENESLRAQVAELTKAAPRITETKTVTNGNGNGEPPNNPTKPKVGTSPREATRGWLGGFRESYQNAP